MSDQTMIERVARAAALEIARQGGYSTDGLNPDLTTDYLDQGIVDFAAVGRAILTAVRDCDAGSPAIVVAGKEALYSCSEDPELADARGCWRAMIDAALAEGLNEI